MEISESGRGIFPPRSGFDAKINVFIQFRIMKNPYFDLTQGKIKLFNFHDTVSGTQHSSSCHAPPPPQEFKLNFLKYVIRHLYDYIGKKISW